MRCRLVSIVALAMLGAGCVDNSPPPARVAVPRNAGEGPLRRGDPVKPMPSDDPMRNDVGSADLPAPAYDDEAMISQELPEVRDFLAAYDRVGRPTLIVEGGGKTDVFAAGSQDRPLAVMLAEWLRADGAVTIITARGVNAQPDVAVEISVDDGNGKRKAANISARASNVRDNQLLGQAMVDMPVPADRGAINRYTRFLARKLMSDMARTWMTAPALMEQPRQNAPMQPETTQPAR